MRAKVVNLATYGSATDQRLNFGSSVRGIVVEGEGGLFITIRDGRVCAYAAGSILDHEGCDVVKVIDMPDDLVAKARALAAAQGEANDHREAYESYLYG